MKVYPLFVPTRSAAADYTSGALSLGQTGSFWIGVTFSGSDVAGTLSLQCSATKDFARPFTVANTSTAITSSAEANFNLTDQNYPYVRVFWDYTSGTGNISVDAAVRPRSVTDVA